MDSTPAREEHRTALRIILAVALVLRLAHWAAVRGAPFFAQLAMDSQEYDRWAQGIAGGDWLGAQVFFQAPLYPYLLALVYRVLGRSLDAVYLLQILAAAAGVWALWRAGRAMGGARVGLTAAALAAVYGPFLFYDVQILKESLAVTVASFLLWALAAARNHDGAGRWLAAGLLLGVLALLRENALLLLPFLLPLAWRRDGAGPFMRRGLLLAVGLVLPLVPVALRNGLVGGDFLPTTFQGGVNFWIGNNPAADGTYQPVVPGKQIPALERQEPVRLAEEALGRRLAPSEVSSYWLHRALAWGAAHPLAFLRLQIRKLGMYWSWYEWPDAVDYAWVRTQSPVYWLPLVEFGTVALLTPVGLWLLWRQRRQFRMAPFAPALLFALGWMLSTVVFFLFSRYRLPGVPALLLIAAVPLVSFADLWRERRQGSLAAAALVAAAFLVPVALRFPPRTDLVEYNLGRLAEERGDDASAEEHYRAALAANPKDFLSWLNLGNHAARRRDFPAALRCYQQAAALEPRSDDAESNLGGVYLALGDFAQAESHLNRALTLNPQNLRALQNGALLRLREGDPAGARELVQRLLELDPTNAAALRLRERIGG